MHSPSAPSKREPILLPALKVGAITGSSGVVLGGIAAVLRSTPTVGLFAAGTGLNCFALGSTFYAVRASLLRVLHDPRASDRVAVSGAAGALTGFALGLLMRGRSNALPGALVWGLAGLGGQYAYDVADARHTAAAAAVTPAAGTPSLLDRAFAAPWNPVRKLSDAEYEALLRARLLAVDAEIAVTDDEIAAVRARIDARGKQ